PCSRFLRVISNGAAFLRRSATPAFFALAYFSLVFLPESKEQRNYKIAITPNDKNQALPKYIVMFGVIPIPASKSNKLSERFRDQHIINDQITVTDAYHLNKFDHANSAAADAPIHCPEHTAKLVVADHANLSRNSSCVSARLSDQAGDINSHRQAIAVWAQIAQARAQYSDKAAHNIETCPSANAFRSCMLAVDYEHILSVPPLLRFMLRTGIVLLIFFYFKELWDFIPFCVSPVTNYHCHASLHLLWRNNRGS